MTTQSIKILFVISATRKNKKGLVPLVCRITYLSKRKPFATGLFINPFNWDSSLQSAKPPNEDNNQINTQLSLIKQEINQAFLFLQVQKKQFDVNDIYLQYKGENIKTEKTLLEVFEIHNKTMKSLVGIEYTKGTHVKFVEAKNHVSDFMRQFYKKRDINLTDLNMKFLKDFDVYLKTVKKHKQITINKSIQRIGKIIKLSISEGFIITDPFLLYKPKKVETIVIYLTDEELKSLEEFQFSQKRLQQVCDLFIFCCYTGLAYEEMSNLKNRNIIKGFDERKWIDMYRRKTKKHFTVPLLPKAIEIIQKYKVVSDSSERIFPRISNQKFNSYIKEIAEIIGIEKNLTHHIARKTFATTILLYNDVPIEVVSELLGHSKISTTQEHYAKVVQKKVSKTMKDLSEKLNETVKNK